MTNPTTNPVLLAEDDPDDSDCYICWHFGMYAESGDTIVEHCCYCQATANPMTGVVACACED